MNRTATTITGLLLAGVPFASNAGLIVAWETWASGDEAATIQNGGATGLGTEGGDWREGSEAPSNDGTFGTVPGASTAGGTFGGTYIGTTGGVGFYSFIVTAGANGLILEGFHFDAQRKRGNSPEFWSVQASNGDITLGNLDSGTLNFVLAANGPSDHADIDIDLTGLADNYLAPGEFATIRINFTGGVPTNTDQKTYLDNVAITGQIVPEPGSLALLGLGGVLAARRRRA